MSSPPDELNLALAGLVLWHRALPCSVPASEAQAWRDTVAKRMEAAGGAQLALAGSSVAAVFDAIELDHVVELALGILNDARQDAQGMEVAIGIALGQDAAIDRAQLLANCAQPGELVLDEATSAQADDRLLFLRVLHAGSASGRVLDKRYAQKRDCRNSLQALRVPMLASSTHASFDHMRALAQKPGARTIVLRAGHPHAALDALADLNAELSPKLLLHVGPQAGSLQPLGGLQLALSRIGKNLDTNPATGPLRAVLHALQRGEALVRGQAVTVLRELLSIAAPHPFIVIERAREVDTPSLTVLAEAIRAHQAEPLVWLLGDEPPGVLGARLRDGEVHSIAIDHLSDVDKIAVAASVLSPTTRADVVRRVGALAQGSVPDVVEAARTLVCSGDLVLDGEEFRFRTEPRVAALAIPLDAWLTERAAGLEGPARCLLEALCIAPRIVGPTFIAAVARLDSLSDESVDLGLEQLAREGWLSTGVLDPMQHAIRSAVRNAMPPSRAAELHRFVAEVLAQDSATPRGFSSALLAYHLAEGGREREAAGALLDTAQAATESDFARIAVRLAALALKLDDSTETKQRAREIAHTLDSRPATHSSIPSAAPDSEPPSSPTDPRSMASSAIANAIGAIARGEVDVAENAIDTAVAAGWGRAGAARLTSIAQLARGDVPAAVRALKQGHLQNAQHSTRSKEAITAALILLAADEPVEAVRSSLEALAASRKAGDKRGQHAALTVLATCYGTLDRPDDQARLTGTAQALSFPSRPTSR